MPITWSHDRSRRRLWLTYTDPYTLDEWAGVARAIADGALPCATVLVDRRQASPPTREYVNAVVAFMERHARQFERVRGAVVVTDAASYGVSRMIETVAELLTLARLRVFEDYADAVAWLEGADDDP